MSKAAIVKAESNAVSTEILGLQNEFSNAISVRKDLIKIPKLKLENALSEGFKGGLADQGEFTCVVKGINFGKSVDIIPLTISESASLLHPKTGELLCSSRDLIRNQDGVLCQKCPHNNYWNDWGTTDKQKIPECKNSIDMIVLVDPVFSADEFLIAQFSLRKNNFKAGKALVNLISGDPRKIPFGRKYTITSKLSSSNNNEYFIVDANKIKTTALTDEELMKIVPIARNILQLKSSGRVQTEYGDEEDSNTPY